MINKLAITTANFINNNKVAQRVFDKIGSNASGVSVGVANTSNFILRPITVMATGKNMMDSAYSASSSICSGISETLSSIFLLKPFKKSVNKASEQLSSSGFFNSMSIKLGDTTENISKRYNNFLSRSMLIFLVGINSIIKMNIHPLFAKKTKEITEKIQKRFDKWG